MQEGVGLKGGGSTSLGFLSYDNEGRTRRGGPGPPLPSFPYKPGGKRVPNPPPPTFLVPAKGWKKSKKSRISNPFGYPGNPPGLSLSLCPYLMLLPCLIFPEWSFVG